MYFQNFGQEGQIEGWRGGERRDKRREDKPVVSEERRVLLRVRKHVPKEESRYGIWTTSSGYGFSKDKEVGRMDVDDVEVNFLWRYNLRSYLRGRTTKGQVKSQVVEQFLWVLGSRYREKFISVYKVGKSQWCWMNIWSQ